MIWLIFVLMAVAVLALMLLPMWRVAPKSAERLDYDVAVYKDQLTEVERDLERGVLTADQGEAARTEIQRRLLAAADTAKAAGKSSSSGRPLAAIIGIAVAVPAVAFGGYILLGSPSVPDQPYTSRAGKIKEMQDQSAMIHSMVDQLSARLARTPDDGNGWAMLGRSLRVLGEPDKAMEAYKRALPLLPGNAQVRMEYASLLVEDVPQGAPLPPPFVAVMREVLAIDGVNPEALYFVGMAEAQAGHAAKAKELWTSLLALMPPDAPERADIAKQIKDLP